MDTVVVSSGTARRRTVAFWTPNAKDRRAIKAYRRAEMMGSPPEAATASASPTATLGFYVRWFPAMDARELETLDAAAQRSGPDADRDAEALANATAGRLHVVGHVGRI